MESEDLRKRFNCIFEALSEIMRLNLSQQRKDMNLTEIKNFGQNNEISNIKGNFETLEEIAVNLATVSLRDSELYDSTIHKINREFDNAFFKYQMYEMNPFLNSMKNITADAKNSLESENNHLETCKNEEDLCKVEQNRLC